MARMQLSVNGAGTGCLPLQVCAIPVTRSCTRFIGALTKVQQRLFRRVGLADIFVHQKEFLLLATIKRFRGKHAALLESRRLRGGIGVESRVFHNFAIARPESVADYFVRVSLFGDRICSRAFWGAST